MTDAGAIIATTIGGIIIVTTAVTTTTELAMAETKGQFVFALFFSFSTGFNCRLFALGSLSSRDRDRHRGGDNYNNRGGGYPRGGDHNKDDDHQITRSDKNRADEKIIRRSDKIDTTTATDDSGGGKTHEVEARMPKYQAPVKPVRYFIFFSLMKYCFNYFEFLQKLQMSNLYEFLDDGGSD